MDRTDATLSPIGPMGCHVMAAAEKQMKGVASEGCFATSITSPRQTVSGWEKESCLLPTYQG